MDHPLTYCIVAGLFGGLVRAAVGITKYFKQNEGERKIKFFTLFFSLFTSFIAGGVTGALSGGDWRLAIVFGYAGTDLLENLYKLTLKQQHLLKTLKAPEQVPNNQANP